nr:Bm7957 [Brugia malayi]
MRSSALPVLQESPRPQPQSLQPPPQPEAPQLPPVAPIYAKHSLATSNQETQTPIATIPIECSPSAELRADNKKSISKESIEPEQSPEKEKDAGTTNGKGGGEGREGGNSTVGIDEKGGRKDDGFDECPDLTPDILKNIINDNC